MRTRTHESDFRSQQCNERTCFGKRRARKNDGSAVIVVLVLLFIMVTFLTLNSGTLRRMKQSVQSIEHRELKKYEKPAVK